MPRKPRYVAIASDLRRAIATGKIGVGDQLPTEVALCQAHGVSRHTARAALQLLEDARLIERKPGLGTRVISKDDRATFIQPLGGLSELLQYAREARLRITTIRPDALSSPEAKRFGASARSRWLRIEGVRRVGDRAVAAASIYVCASIGARAKDFENLKSAVTEAIERRYGISVAKINQTIRSEALSAEDASVLGAREGAPALRTIRRYYDAAGRLFVISDTRHPGERFAYEMNYRREGAGGARSRKA